MHRSKLINDDTVGKSRSAPSLPGGGVIFLFFLLSSMLNANDKTSANLLLPSCRGTRARASAQMTPRVCLFGKVLSQAHRVASLYFFYFLRSQLQKVLPYGISEAG